MRKKKYSLEYWRKGRYHIERLGFSFYTKKEALKVQEEIRKAGYDSLIEKKR